MADKVKQLLDEIKELDAREYESLLLGMTSHTAEVAMAYGDGDIDPAWVDASEALGKATIAVQRRRGN